MLGPRRGLPALLCALLVAACGTATPTPSPAPSAAPSEAAPSPSPVPSTAASSAPSGDVAAVARSILADVEELRGLTASRAVAPEALSQAELEAYVDRVLGEISAEEWRSSEALLRHLGLIRTDDTLQELFAKLLETQTAGFYDPEASRLVVLAKTGELGPAERITLAHELTHMLQDQHHDLEKLDLRGVASGLIREPRDRTDRNLGVLALTEGDATVVMFRWAQQRLSAAELGVIAAGDPESVRILNDMPLIVRETLLYPYLTGLQFALGLQATGGWPAVDAAYAKPPASTEQILHPEKYAAAEEPVAVELPADLAARMGDGWTVGLEDTFGEFDTRVWLQDVGGMAAVGAAAAAAGWGGDRLMLVEHPDGGWAIAWRTAWDSAGDAEEFSSGAGVAVERLATPGSVVPGAGGTEAWVVLASDADVLGRIANALGLAA